jgi:hypothetical protein
MSPTSHAVGSFLRQTRPPRRLTAKLMKSGSPIWTVSCLSICQNEALSVDSVPAPITRFGAMTSLSTYLGTAADAALAQDGRGGRTFGRAPQSVSLDVTRRVNDLSLDQLRQLEARLAGEQQIAGVTIDAIDVTPTAETGSQPHVKSLRFSWRCRGTHGSTYASRVPIKVL